MRQWKLWLVVVVPTVVGLNGCQSAGRMHQVENNRRLQSPEVGSGPRPSGGRQDAVTPKGDNSVAKGDGPRKPLGRPIDLEAPTEKPPASSGGLSGLISKFSRPKRVPLPRTDLDVFPETGEEMTASIASEDDFSAP